MESDFCANAGVATTRVTVRDCRIRERILSFAFHRRYSIFSRHLKTQAQEIFSFESKKLSRRTNFNHVHLGVSSVEAR